MEGNWKGYKILVPWVVMNNGMLMYNVLRVVFLVCVIYSGNVKLWAYGLAIAIPS